MADLDRRYAQGTTVGRAETGVIDQGLRSYMLRVYNYMASGVAITGVVAYLTYMFAVVDSGAGLQLTPFGNLIFASAVQMGGDLRAARHACSSSRRASTRMSLSAAQISFWVFAAVMGAVARRRSSWSTPCEHRARVLHYRGVASARFSLYGYTTQA